MRVFYVAYVTDYVLRMTVDAIRLLADPSVKWSSHVTLRGPYDSVQDFGHLGALLRGSEVRIEGVGRFQDAGQNTVFLGAHCPVFPLVWDKPDFGFVPHLTVYDGPDRAFSDALTGILHRAPIRRTFIADGLTPLISGDGARELCPGCVIFSNQVASIIEMRLTGALLAGLDDTTRLDCIARLWHFITRDDSEPVPDVSIREVGPSSLAARRVNRCG